MVATRYPIEPLLRQAALMAGDPEFSVRALADQCGLHPSTPSKWKRRGGINDRTADEASAEATR